MNWTRKIAHHLIDVFADRGLGIPDLCGDFRVAVTHTEQDTALMKKEVSNTFDPILLEIEDRLGKLEEKP